MPEIPGVETLHSRQSWQDPAWPVYGPPSPTANIDTAVIHYTAADNLIDGDPGEHAEDLPQYFRDMQYAYAKPKAIGGRGYSLGYRWGVDWLGGVWQIRGWDYMSAANKGHNDHTEPILVLVDGNDQATAEAVHSIRCIIAESQRRSGRTFKISGHGQLRRDTGVGTATACPGLGLQAQVAAGVFAPVVAPTPPPTPPSGAPEMFFFVVTNAPGAEVPETWTLCDGTQLSHVVDGHAAAVFAAADVPVVRSESADQTRGVIKSCKTMTPCPPEWEDTGWETLWNTSRAR